MTLNLPNRLIAVNAVIRCCDSRRFSANRNAFRSAMITTSRLRARHGG
jgi:hypothetical protein